MIYWLICKLDEVAPGDEWLGERERERQSALRFPKRRDDWRLGRWTAKRLLVARFRLSGIRVEPAQIEILPAPDGAPGAFLSGEPAGIALSLSHSAGVGFCVAGLPDTALGCDIEEIVRRDPGFVADFFRAEETAALAEVPASEKALLANLIWSTKESALKALREGLRRDTRGIRVGFSVEPDSGGWRPLRADCLETGREFTGWWREDEGRVLTVVSSRRVGTPALLNEG